MFPSRPTQPVPATGRPINQGVAVPAKGPSPIPLHNVGLSSREPHVNAVPGAHPTHQYESSSGPINVIHPSHDQMVPAHVISARKPGQP